MRNETVSTIIIFYIQNLMTRRFVLTSSDGSKLLDSCSTRARLVLNIESTPAQMWLNFCSTHHYKTSIPKVWVGQSPFRFSYPFFAFWGVKFTKCLSTDFLMGSYLFDTFLFWVSKDKTWKGIIQHLKNIIRCVNLLKWLKGKHTFYKGLIY